MAAYCYQLDRAYHQQLFLLLLRAMPPVTDFGMFEELAAVHEGIVAKTHLNGHESSI